MQVRITSRFRTKNGSMAPGNVWVLQCHFESVAALRKHHQCSNMLRNTECITNGIRVELKDGLVSDYQLIGDDGGFAKLGTGVVQ